MEVMHFTLNYTYPKFYIKYIKWWLCYRCSNMAFLYGKTGGANQGAARNQGAATHYKIRSLVENHRRLKECCRKKNHDDEDTGAGVYNLIVDQMASQEARREG